MDKENPENVELWVVVCSQFHSARGPFMDPKVALKAAHEMTADSSSGCIYIPVLFKTSGVVKIIDEPKKVGPKSKKNEKETRYYGQYL